MLFLFLVTTPLVFFAAVSLMELTKRNTTSNAGDLEANEYDSKTDGKTRPGNLVERSVGFLSSTNGKRLLVCLIVLYLVHWVIQKCIFTLSSIKIIYVSSIVKYRARIRLFKELVGGVWGTS